MLYIWHHFLEHFYLELSNEIALYHTGDHCVFFLDEGGYHGICVDIWKKISDNLNFSYTISEITNWDKWPEAIREGHGDVGIQTMIWTEERDGAFEYTPPYQVSETT